MSRESRSVEPASRELACARKRRPLGKPKEPDWAAADLVRLDGAFIGGQSIAANGGRTVW